MNLPRLLICALLLAPAFPAHADPLPTWTTKEETFTSWNILTFADDSGAWHEVWCRWNECGRGVKTGRSKLYVMERGASEPYMYQGSQSAKTHYETKLSNFELDMATGKVVVPGTTKAFPPSYPAQLSPTGYLVIVAPPKAMANDLPKPPVTRSPVVTNPPPVTVKPPVRRRRPPTDENDRDVYPKDEDVIGKVTALKDWVGVTSKHGFFHCYLPGHPAAAATGAWLHTAHKGGLCVDWSTPSPDAVADEGGKKYKTRPMLSRGVIYHRGGKVVLHMGSKRIGLSPKIEATSETAFGAAYVKIGPAATAPVAGAVPVTDQERRWLSKAQRDAYDAGKGDLKAAAAAAREAVKKNLRPDPGVAAAYAAAVTGGKPAEIDAALAPLKMWGGEQKNGVGPWGESAEIQLSKKEWDDLGAISLDEQKKYMDARVAFAGGPASEPIQADAYFPVDLHLLTEAARTKLPDPNAPKPVSTKPLTQAEMDLLTPEELAAYKKSYLEPATVNGVVDENNENLKRESARLRQLIADEKRTAYTAPKSAAEFETLQQWQKKKFCADFPPKAGAVAGDRRGNDIDNRTNARSGLDNTAGTKPAKQPKTDATPDFADADKQALCDKWRKVPDTINPTNGDGTSTNNQTTTIPPVGKDEGPAKKEPNPWMDKAHIYNGVKGAMVGALIGSFGGPIGALAGALIVGAIFWVTSKLTS